MVGGWWFLVGFREKKAWSCMFSRGCTCSNVGQKSTASCIGVKPSLVSYIAKGK